MSNWVKLKFAAMNLKKFACWLWKEKLAPFAVILLWLYTPETRLMLDAYAGFLDRLREGPEFPVPPCCFLATLWDSFHLLCAEYNAHDATPLFCTKTPESTPFHPAM